MRRIIYLFFALSVICLLLQASTHAHAGQPPPDGWRYPGEADFAGSWLEFRDEIPEPFHVHADFDGNGIEDNAWILIKEDGTGWGLFVFMNKNDGQIDMIKLLDGPIQSYTGMGIELVPPGVYDTVCGKGYWDCGPGETEEIELKNPGINFFVYESANAFYYWNDAAGKFSSISISD